MKIYKYELAITDSQVIPIGDSFAKPLCVAEQDGKLCMWVQLDENRQSNFAFGVKIFGTGNPIDDLSGHEYVGSVIMSNSLVWHVYVCNAEV